MNYLEEVLRPRLKELNEAREAGIARMEAATAAAALESRSELNEAEDAEFKEARAAIAAIDADIETVRSRITDLEAIEAGRLAADEVQRSAGGFSIPSINRGRDPWDTDELRSANRDGIHGQVRAALDTLTLESREKESAERLLKLDSRNADFGRRLIVTGSPSYRTAFAKVMEHRNHSLTDQERNALGRWEELRAASLTDNAGGYAVPFTLDPTIIDTGAGSVNPFRQLASVRTTVTDTWNGVTSAGVTASWDAEASEASDDAPTLAAAPITLGKGVMHVPFSIEVGMDWANMEADIRSMFQVGKDDLEAAGFATGTGTNQPIGIVTALDGTASEVAPTTAETFAVADLYKLEEELPAKYRARASWVANKAIYNDIRQFGTADSHALWERLGAGQPAQLLGYNAYEASAMDSGFNAAATADNFLLILGDFSNYVIVDRVGMSVEYIPHLFATANNRPSGQRAWYAYWRTGADSVNDGAFRMLNVATAA